MTVRSTQMLIVIGHPASSPTSTRGNATEPTSTQFVHDDINLPGPQEPTDDDSLGLEELLAPFANLQLDSRGTSSRAIARAASCAASCAASPAACPAAV